MILFGTGGVKNLRNKQRRQGKCSRLLKIIKISVIVIVIVMINIICFTSCSRNKMEELNTINKNSSEKISVSASFYVMYDFSSKIGGDKASVENLLPYGTDPHTWEPSPKDIVSIQNARMLVYNGAGMEKWIEKVLKSIDVKNIIVVETSKNVKLLEIKFDEIGSVESSDGQQSNQAHVYDPHVWLDPSRAKLQIREIADAYIKIDPGNSDYYEKNYEYYAMELDKLDSEYKEAVSKFKTKDIVVSHAAFGYLCDAYGLRQIAISGLDEEAEPTALRMVEISEYIKANGITTVFFDKFANPKVIESIANSTGVKIAELNPIASLSLEEIEAGKDYFTTMRDNLETLKKALN